ncbi:hypothetical protein, partial [Nocardia farcinica]|uniref:hypothetical protein n=1 Tax=Nocardia farcinica TaxID=37329 RepID=UPI001E520F06
MLIITDTEPWLAGNAMSGQVTRRTLHTRYCVPVRPPIVTSEKSVLPDLLRISSTVRLVQKTVRQWIELPAAPGSHRSQRDQHC